MSRFDVYSLPGDGRAEYVIDVQSNILRDLTTRVVVPLFSPEQMRKGARGLNPTFEINGRLYTMMTQFIAAVSTKQLGAFVVSLELCSDDITRAIDFLLVGF